MEYKSQKYYTSPYESQETKAADFHSQDIQMNEPSGDYNLRPPNLTESEYESDSDVESDATERAYLKHMPNTAPGVTDYTKTNGIESGKFEPGSELSSGSETETNQDHVMKKVNIKHQIDLFPNITDVADGIGPRRDNPQDDVSLAKLARDEDENSEKSNCVSNSKIVLSKKDDDNDDTGKIELTKIFEFVPARQPEQAKIGEINL